MAIDQETETQQGSLEGTIITTLGILYELLQLSDRPEAEDHIGTIAEMKAFWEGDSGSADNGG